MQSEFEKMLSGQEYWINGPDLVEFRFTTRERVDQFNETSPRDGRLKAELQK